MKLGTSTEERFIAEETIEIKFEGLLAMGLQMESHLKRLTDKICETECKLGHSACYEARLVIDNFRMFTKAERSRYEKNGL